MLVMHLKRLFHGFISGKCSYLRSAVECPSVIEIFMAFLGAFSIIWGCSLEKR